ncbi:MAG: glycerol-3-phosphate acyltransferase [Anaerolineae bacterium]|nr:glycerol-3-phosphate acyltransferase [Anaerolineae bacterium]
MFSASNILVFILAFYVVGSVPTGYIASSFLQLDILSFGSGKIGSTNLWRLAGPKYAIPVFLIDATKGVIAIAIARQFPDTNNQIELILSLATLSGHSWSVFLKLKTGKWHGGRSVAVAAGALLLVSPIALLGGMLITLIVTRISRYVSLGVLVGIGVCCAIVIILSLIGKLSSNYTTFAIAIGAFLVIRHLENIQRLMSGTERRIKKRDDIVGSKLN